MPKPVKISVHKIVDLILRSGDIDSRFGDSSAMYKGAAAHRKLQKGEGYKKEVALKFETEIDGIAVVIQGRADGIIHGATEGISPGAIIIDEIKTTTLPLDYLFNQHLQHLAQAKCYACMYLHSLENPLFNTLPEQITIRLTYFQLDTEEIRRHEFPFTADEVRAFFADLLEKYGIWLRFERDWKAQRDASCVAAEFPFPWRKGQREFAALAYRAISAQKKLYVAAPTGIGKTLSALFPAVKAIGKCEKIFYLTAKTITRTVAEDALKHLTTRGLRFKSITLRAKDKICPAHREGQACTPDSCPNARGHFDRINDALWDLLNAVDLITPAEVAEFAQKHSVCPHEFALDAALHCDLIIGDYNHVFDPSVYLRRFFNTSGDYVFLIDEAHNLADRVRDMYTATLSKGAFGGIFRRLKDKNPEAAALRKISRKINTFMADLRTDIPAENPALLEENDPALLALAENFFRTAGEWLKIHAGHEMYSEILNLYFDANMYMLISELYDQHFTTLTETRGSDVLISLFCLDPSGVIAAGLSRGISAILFSATLTPLDYYREILGGTPDDTAIALPSPFDPSRLKIVIRRDISAKYAHREQSYVPIAEAIHAAVAEKPGNYLAFFPSYDYMNKVSAIFYENYPTVKTLVQTSDMTEDERADFLARFSADNTEALVGFTVLGGIFSEGIDLTGDRLIGAIIVSAGIPKISMRSDKIRDYFNRKNGRGYDFAYVFPGMNKVLQAAGRVIRTETDEGIVLLLDSRFATEKYRQMFPAHWV
ncbi:MAG: ATP-dependent DNA helicase [Defluviitaleaceae bacterium]|nr:ATP-dependent DNA helicase [Defluviitaleaceae bacterium]